MLPLIIGGLCAAVGCAAGAITSHAAGEKDQQAAKQLEKVNTELIKSRAALEERYHELSDISKDRVSDLQYRLVESELEKDALYLVVRLQSSLLLLMQAIDRDPTFEVLFQFWEAVNQTNVVLNHLGEEINPVSKDYFSRNLTRAKLKATQRGEALTPEQKKLLNKLLLTVSDGFISCPHCREQNAVMKNMDFVKCNSCGSSIDLINSNSEIQWNVRSTPTLSSTHQPSLMATNTISVSNISLVQLRLVEVRDTGHITVNDRHFALKAGMTIDITSSLCEGMNIITLVVGTVSLKDNLSRLLDGKHEWAGLFEIYVDGKIAGSYLKRGAYIVGGKENIIASIEINVAKDVSKPTVMQLMNQLQTIPGMTDADKADFYKSHPHIVFKNGIIIHTWKNYAGVDHVFVSDRSEKCVYGGYVGWIHSKYLQDVLKKLHDEFREYTV